MDSRDGQGDNSKIVADDCRVEEWRLQSIVGMGKRETNVAKMSNGLGTELGACPLLQKRGWEKPSSQG